MWTNLIVKNFKSVGERGIDLELKPLTLFVGPNGSGKSSILEAIAILPANVGRPDFQLTGELVQFSAHEEIAYKHEVDRWLVWEIRLPNRYGVRLEYKHDSGEAKETVIKSGRNFLQLSLEGNRQAGHRLMVMVGEGQPIGPINTILTKLDGSTIPLVGSIRGEPASAATWNEAMSILDSVGADLREKVFLLSGLRGRIPSTSSTFEVPKWVGTYGQGVLPLLSVISSSPLYEKTWAKVQDWAVQFGLSKLSAGLRGSNILSADYYDPEIRTTINLAFAGQGSRQLISVITQLFWAKPGSLIMIEEPELSLHPEAQVKLGGLFADAIKEDKQIMVSTHSHFLLLALSQAVENGLKVHDIAVYHVTKGKEGTKAAPVKLSQRGYPLGWPPSYEKVERELALNWAKGLAEK